MKIIAGENRKKTVCKEFGIKLLVNPEKVYYSVRSGTERKRIADQVKPGEKILVMFSGIGIYPLMIAKYSLAEHIIGVELNRDAHDFGVENIALNKVNNVTLYHGDVSDIVGSFGNTFDRVVMPLPKTAHLFIPLALRVLKPNGLLHLYQFQEKSSLPHCSDYLGNQCIENHRKLAHASFHLCGHPSPSKYRICIDGVIS